jgi:type IV secretion system protein VirB9
MKLIKSSLPHVAVMLCLALTPLLSEAQAVKRYTYGHNKIYPVQTGLGVATQIELDPSEKIRDYGTGFSSGWDIVRRDNVFFLKPKDPDAETNMYVRTDRRSYLFDLKIVTKDWKRLEEAKASGVTYVVQFSYPDTQDEVLGAGVKARQDAVLADLAPPKSDPYLKFNMEYEYAAADDSKWLVPLRAYDDGEVTYVQMPAHVSAPAFFGRASDRGEEFLLNKTNKKNLYVLHGVHPFIVIRHGNSVVGVRRRS